MRFRELGKVADRLDEQVLVELRAMSATTIDRCLAPHKAAAYSGGGPVGHPPAAILRAAIPVRTPMDPHRPGRAGSPRPARSRSPPRVAMDFDHGAECMNWAVIALRWTAILDPTYTSAAPVIGTITGALAGIYPAARAAHITPVTAPRQ